MISVPELRQSIRSLAKQPGLTLVIIATLALGIGSATAVFDLVNLLSWRTLPGQEPDRLVKLYTHHPQAFIGNYGFTLVRDVDDYSDGSTSLDGLAAVVDFEATLDTGNETRRVPCGAVGGQFFETLGIHSALGRLPGPQDDRPEAEPVAALSHRLWQRLGSDPDLLGSSVRLDGRDFSIIGIVPPELTSVVAGTPMDVWIPLVQQMSGDHARTPDERAGTVIGRLRPGVSVDAAQDEVSAIAVHLDAEDPLDGQLPREPTLEVATIGHPIDRVRLTPTLRLFGIAAFLLLGIACANVAHLLLARATTRHREIAIRQALGANRARLIRQLLTESLLLALAAAVAGLLVVILARELNSHFAGEAIAGEARLDHRVLSLGLLISSASTLLFGLVPALFATRQDLVTHLRGGAAGAAPRRRSWLALGAFLGVLQIALAVVLLGSGGLLLRSLENLKSADLGFDNSSLLISRLDLPETHSEPEQWLATQQRILEAARALPGVAAVGRSSLTPPLFLDINVRFHLPNAPDEERRSRLNLVDTAYLEAVGIPLVRGRHFEASDRTGPPVALVNRKLAEELWPGEDPLGQTLTVIRKRPWDAGPTYRVVGVVGNVRQFVSAPGLEPVLYFSLDQRPRENPQLVLRTEVPPATVTPALREAVRAIDPGIAFQDLRSSTEYQHDSLVLERLRSQCVAVFAGMGLFLCVCGIFGLLAYSVGLRSREWGIRLALGATPGRIRSHVLARCLRMTAAGLVLGGVGLVATSRFLAGHLHGITVADPPTLAAVLVGTIVSCVGAAALPAFRASATQPQEALRAD